MVPPGITCMPANFTLVDFKPIYSVHIFHYLHLKKKSKNSRKIHNEVLSTRIIVINLFTVLTSKLKIIKIKLINHKTLKNIHFTTYFQRLPCNSNSLLWAYYL